MYICKKCIAVIIKQKFLTKQLSSHFCHVVVKLSLLSSDIGDIIRFLRRKKAVFRISSKI